MVVGERVILCCWDRHSDCIYMGLPHRNRVNTRRGEEVCSWFNKLMKDREQAYETNYAFHEDPRKWQWGRSDDERIVGIMGDN